MELEKRARWHAGVFGVGAGVWLIALVVLVVLRGVCGVDVGLWLWVAGLGVLMGLGGVLYARRSWRAR